MSASGLHLEGVEEEVPKEHGEATGTEIRDDRREAWAHGELSAAAEEVACESAEAGPRVEGTVGGSSPEVAPDERVVGRSAPHLDYGCVLLHGRHQRYGTNQYLGSRVSGLPREVAGGGLPVVRMRN
jgi:hypothetical protein